jgi:uncharacterized protein (TIGR00369 family)
VGGRLNRSGAPKLGLAARPPAARLLGRQVTRTNRRTGEVWMRFRSQPSFLNRHGFVQGGLLAAMLDSTMGCAAMASLPPGESIVTLEIKVTFLRPAPPGIIRGFGRLLQRGRSILFVEGDLRDPKGNVLARASATLRVVAAAKSGERPPQIG